MKIRVFALVMLVLLGVSLVAAGCGKGSGKPREALQVSPGDVDNTTGKSGDK